MKVLIVEPGKYPREADIEHTLEAEQAVVGGTIEAVYPWKDNACIYLFLHVLRNRRAAFVFPAYEERIAPKYYCNPTLSLQFCRN